MSELSDYMMAHHFDAMANPANPNVDDAALEVIKAQDAYIVNNGRYIRGGDGSHWDGCDETHWDCKIAKLERENAELRAALNSARDVIEWALATDGEMPSDYKAREEARVWLRDHPTPPAQAGEK